MTTVAQSASSFSIIWFGRLRFALSVAVVWAGLHFIAGRVVGVGLDRPLVMAGALHSISAGLLLIALLWVGAAAVTLIAGARDARQPLLILGLALTLWAAEGGQRGGTMDSWLILRHEKPGPPTSGPYWALLGDYFYLLAAIAGVHVIATRLTPRAAETTVVVAGPRDQRRRGQPSPAWTRGLLATLLTTVIAGVALYFLTGAPTEATRRWQVYFAAAVGFAAGVFAAGRLTQVRDPLWYWPAPFVLGLAGILVAAINPALRLPEIYRQLDTLPAWGLVRALPVELVGVGLTATLWMLQTVTPRAAQRQ